MSKIKNIFSPGFVLKLKTDLRKIVASYVRAAVGLLSGTQIADAFNARGWGGVWTSLSVAAIPAALAALQTLAQELDPQA